MPLAFRQDTPAAEQPYVTSIWANTFGIGTLIAGVLCPIVGVALDITEQRKFGLLIVSFAMLACLTAFAWMDSDAWTFIVILSVAALAFRGLFEAVYNSLLMHVSDSSEEALTFMSSFQCAIGNVGGMIIMLALGIQNFDPSTSQVP